MKTRLNSDQIVRNRVGALISRATKTLVLLSVTSVLLIVAVIFAQSTNNPNQYSGSQTPSTSAKASPSVSSFGFLRPKVAHAATQTTPYRVNFQARLTDQNGNIMPDGNYNIKFRLYDTKTGGALKWEGDYLNSNAQGVAITNGIFDVQLGDVNTTGTINPALFADNPSLYLEVELPTPASSTCTGASCASWTEGPMSPRQKLASAPYAMNADAIDGIDSTQLARVDQGNTFTGNNTFSNDLTVQGSTSFSGSLSVTGATSMKGALTLGNSTTTGQLLFYDGSSNTVTLQSAAQANDVALAIPADINSTDTLCLKTLANCGYGGAGSGAGVASVNSLDGDLTIQGTANQISVADNGTDTITLSLPQDINTTSNVTFGGMNVNGSGKYKTDSTTAFQVQNAAGTNTVLNVDTTNTRVGIGTAAPDYSLDVRQDFSTTNEPSTIHLSSNNSDDGTYLFDFPTGSIGEATALTNNAKFDASSGNFTATNSSAGYVGMYGGNFVIAGDTGLTPSSTYTPTQLLAVTPTQSSFTTGVYIQGGLTTFNLNTPGAPTVTAEGTTGSTTWGYKITAVSLAGETLASSETQITDGNATLDTSNYNRIVPSKVPGATQYNVYRTTAGGTPSSTGLIGYVGATNTNFYLDDTGLSASGSVPTSDTSGSASINGNLSVSGDSTFSGDLAVSGNYLQNGNIIVQTSSTNANAFFGTNTATAAVTGTSNTALGDSALKIVSSGASNTAVGSAALQANTTGAYNTSVGASSLLQNTGSNNTALGYKALGYNTTGSNNVAIGYAAGSINYGLTQNNTSTNSIYIGSNAHGNGNDDNEIVIGTSAYGAGSNSVTIGNSSVTSTHLQGAISGGSLALNSTLTGGGNSSNIGVTTQPSSAPSSATDYIGFNVQNIGGSSNLNSNATIQGSKSMAAINGSTAGSVIGVYGIAGVYGGASTITNVTAINSQLMLATSSGSSSISNAYGVQVQSPFVFGTNTVSNLYGLYIADQTAGSNNYGIYTNSGANHFGDKTTVAATNSSAFVVQDASSNILLNADTSNKKLTVSGDVSLDGGKKLNIGTPNSYAVGATFANQTDYSVGYNPQSVITADLDSDGKPDAIVTNAGDDNISVLKNTTSGGVASFASQATFSTGDFPISAATADLDSDGKPDIMVVNNSDKTVSVLKNTSSGGTISFASQATFNTGNNPVFVTTADLNADGKPDMIVANKSDATVSVYKNTSSGGTISFAAPTTLTTGAWPVSIATTDLNGDGKPDLAVAAMSSSRVYTFQNTSSGGTISFATSASYVVTGSPVSIAVGDVDGDSHPDIVTANSTDHTLGVLINNGDGTFASPVYYAHLPSPRVLKNISLADMNGDGSLDVVAASYGTGVNISYNNGSGGFIKPSPYGNTITTQSEAVADIDGDGKPDIIALNLGQQRVSILINSTQTYTSGGSAMSVKTGATNVSGLIIQGASGQMADLLHIQDALGNTLLSLNSAGDLGVSGNVSAINNLSVAGDASIGGTLSVSGGASFSGTVSGANAVSGSQFVTLGQANGKYIQNTSSPQTANFNVTGNGTIGGNLAVTGKSSLTGALSINTTSTASMLNIVGASGITIQANSGNSLPTGINLLDKNGNSYFKIAQGNGFFGIPTYMILGNSTQSGLMSFVNGSGNSYYLGPSASTSSGGTATLPTGTGTLCYQSSADCGFIQSGTSPQTANFNITGAGTIGGDLSVAGGSLLKTTSSTALQIQDSSANSLLLADTSNMIIKIGTTGTPNLSGASLLVKSLEVQQGLRIGDATNYVMFDASTHEPILFGSARHSRTISLVARYAGAVFDTSGSNGHSGTMTNGYDSTENTNYYNWTSTDSSINDDDVVVQIPVPSDWSAWAATNPIRIKAYTDSTSQCSLSASITDTAGTSDISSADILPGSASTWTAKDPGNLTGTYNTGGVMTLRLHMGSKSNCNVRTGTITLNYLSKF